MGLCTGNGGVKVAVAVHDVLGERLGNELRSISQFYVCLNRGCNLMFNRLIQLSNIGFIATQASGAVCKA